MKKNGLSLETPEEIDAVKAIVLFTLLTTNLKYKLKLENYTPQITSLEEYLAFLNGSEDETDYFVYKELAKDHSLFYYYSGSIHQKISSYEMRANDRVIKEFKEICDFYRENDEKNWLQRFKTDPEIDKFIKDRLNDLESKVLSLKRIYFINFFLNEVIELGGNSITKEEVEKLINTAFTRWTSQNDILASSEYFPDKNQYVVKLYEKEQSKALNIKQQNRDQLQIIENYNFLFNDGRIPKLFKKEPIFTEENINRFIDKISTLSEPDTLNNFFNSLNNRYIDIHPNREFYEEILPIYKEELSSLKKIQEALNNLDKGLSRAWLTKYKIITTFDEIIKKIELHIKRSDEILPLP